MGMLAGLVAVSTYGGALGPAAGFVDLGPAATARLPWHSPVDPRRDAEAIAVGLLVIIWIGVEVADIRKRGFLQPVFIAIGAVIVWLGASTTADRRTHDRR
jgi:hypothetical protein